MAVTNFIPELWAAELQTSFKKSLVFAAPAVANRNYEGTIANGGDTVHITTITRPTIATYTKGTALSDAESLTDADRTLVVDQAKHFNFQIDDIDKAQSANSGNLMSEAMSEAAYGLADVADQYVAGLYVGVASDNAIGTVSITTAALADQGLINLRQKLQSANVPSAGRYVIVPPWYYSLLLGSDKFVRYDASGSTGALREGLVGRAYGFDVYESNNCVNVTGDDWIVQAGSPTAITFAQQIANVEAYRVEKAFADGLKGLNLYGAKLTRPTGIATMAASIT